MTRIGEPAEHPEIEVIPLEDPVPRVLPLEVPKEPATPEREPDLVPA
jgi:hypothetical protein